MTEKKPDWYAWLIYDEAGAAANQTYIRMHHDIGRQYGIQFELLLPWQAEQRIKKNDRTGYPDFAIVRTIRPDLSESMEQVQIPVFNPALVSRICNDKGRTISYVQENSSVPVIPTERHVREELSEAFLQYYPSHVIKAVDGHGGTQVFRTSEPYEKILRGIGRSDFVIQPFVAGRGEDVRVYVIGREMIAAIKRTAKDGFRSNFSLGGSVCTYAPDKKEIRQVREICELFDFGMAGIDFLIDEKGHFMLNEIEDVAGARMLYQCQPKVRLLERYFTFILDKILHYT